MGRNILRHKGKNVTKSAQDCAKRKFSFRVLLAKIGPNVTTKFMFQNNPSLHNQL